MDLYSQSLPELAMVGSTPTTAATPHGFHRDHPAPPPKPFTSSSAA